MELDTFKKWLISENCIAFDSKSVHTVNGKPLPAFSVLPEDASTHAEPTTVTGRCLGS